MNDGPHDELISALLDGELSVEERRQVEQLLADDPACRQLYEELRMVRATVAGLPRHRLNKDLSRRVLRRAERRMLLGGDSEKASKPATAPAKAAALAEAIWQRDWRTILWPALAVSVALLLFVFNRGIWSPSTDPPAPGDAIAGKAPATGRFAERSKPREEKIATSNKRRGSDRSAQGSTMWVIAEVSPEAIRQSSFHELLEAHEISLADSAPRRSPPRGGAPPARTAIEEANRKAGESGEVAYVITGARQQIERTLKELRERDETYTVIEEKALPEQQQPAASLASNQAAVDSVATAPAVARRYATRAEAEDAASKLPDDPASDPGKAAEMVSAVIVLRSAASKDSKDEE
jgi:hypothetical protein